MKQSKIYSQFFCFSLLLFFSALVNADRQGDIEAIFNWAEQKHSNLFSPKGVITQTIPDFEGRSWHYRFYPETDTYMGINDEDKVYVNGTIFDGLTYIDTMSSILALVNNDGGDSSVGGSCANIPLIASGLKMTNRLTVGNRVIDHETEYTEVTETQLKKIDKEILPDGETKNSLIEERYTIANGYMEISGTTTSNIDKPDQQPLVTKNTPVVRMAVNEVCVDQNWQDDYDLESIIGGQVFTTIKISLGTTVEAVNESITTAAGTFNTIRMRHNLSSPLSGLESFSWISIEHGVKVRGGHYKESGEFVGEEELISLQ